MAKYIILEDSVSSRLRWFKTIQYLPELERNQSIRETFGGGLDIVQGSNYRNYKYAVRCSDEQTDEEVASGDPWGTRNDLEYFWSLSNPVPTSGSPSSILTLTDHYGVEHNVFFVGQHKPEPLTTTIEGQCAHFVIPIQLKVFPT